MLVLKNVKNLNGDCIDHTIESEKEIVIDGEGRLLLLPGLIDPHVHFRTPGDEHKENWKSGGKAAIAGGITTVFDMPNNTPSCITAERLHAKMQLIDNQLKEIGIPLRYHLYFGASQDHIEEIPKVSREVIGIKIFMGSSTGDLLITDDSILQRIFQLAAQLDIIVSVHAECEHFLQSLQKKYAGETDPAIHSKVRDRVAAITAVEKAIHFAENYGTQVFILHVTTKEEIEMIRKAKKRGVLVYAEATPHHLFLTEKAYDAWGCKVQMNPPLRTQEDQDALWAGIHDGTINTIGTDHAPHTLEEKNLPYGRAPSGVPGIETMLPLLLNAYNQGKLSLQKILDLTRFNIIDLFRLKANSDVVLVDLDLEKEVSNNHLQTKCGWSPFEGWKLKGWPIYTILKGECYRVDSQRSESSNYPSVVA